MKICENMTRGQDRPWKQSNVGRVLLYDGRPAVVASVDVGEYGERVTFEVEGAIITTTPGLDVRLEWV